MQHMISLIVRSGSQCVVTRLIQASILGLFAVALAVPARAADTREVQTRVTPVYPEIAKRMRITGLVKVEAVVDASGQVKEAKGISGSEVLQRAAEDAVRRWKFEPGPSQSVVEVQLRFAL